MKTRLPLLVQRSIAEAKTARSELAEAFGLQLKSRLAGEGAGVTCTKGCSNCCYHPLYITLLEGVSLYQRLRESGLWTTRLREALQEHMETTRGLAPEVWALSLIPCPLLDAHGLCKAYDDRPFACQVTYSIGHPEECHPHRLGPGMIAKRELFEAITPTETELLRRHRLSHFRLPLSTAVIYGEKIATGETELEDCHQALLEMTHA